MEDHDVALFELLTPPVRAAKLATPRLGAIGVKWTTYSGAHKPCDLCVQEVHERGVATAPPPRPARKKRAGPNDTLLLCDIDAEEMRRKDAEAEKVHKERVARTGGVSKRPPAKRKTREGAS